MSSKRRGWGSLVEGVKIGLWFEGPANRRLTALADAANVTRSEMAQWLVESVEVDEEGCPVHWAETHDADEEELPMTG